MTSYDVWFLRYEVRQTELFDILGHFLSFYPNNNPENQNFEKMEKKPEDTILLHKCNINHDHMLYCFWDTMCADVIFIFHFGLFFQSFTPQQPTKSKLKKWEKNRPGDIIILHMCAKHYYHMMYGSSDMVCNRWTDRQTDRQTKWHIEVEKSVIFTFAFQTYGTHIAKLSTFSHIIWEQH